MQYDPNGVAEMEVEDTTATAASYTQDYATQQQSYAGYNTTTQAYSNTQGYTSQDYRLGLFYLNFPIAYLCVYNYYY